MCLWLQSSSEKEEELSYRKSLISRVRQLVMQIPEVPSNLHILSSRLKISTFLIEENVKALSFTGQFVLVSKRRLFSLFSP